MSNTRKYILTPGVFNIGRKILLACAAMSAVLGTLQLTAAANDTLLKRGKYIVSIAGCGDCHTPGYLLGKPDISRSLGGSEVGFEIPGLGVFHGPNLTPDNETGLGKWTADEIVTAFQTGKRPDGRELAPIMPWRNFASFTPEDAQAIAAYLKSLPPIANKVPGPFGPTDKPTSFVMKVVPPGN
ncbi:MAG: cytochrome c [Aestuariivirga sp.]